MIITLDWETFYSDDYSLKKMTTEAYVRDPRFKAHGLAIKFDDMPARWFPPGILAVPKMRRLIETSAVLAHHAQFDGLILNHHFDLRPALWLDTLSMARIAVPHERHSLDNLSKLFGLPGKQHQHLADAKGVYELNAQMLAGLASMSCDDADKTYKIFQAIKDAIPKEEYRIIDWTVRMFTEPMMRLDEPKMRVYYAEVLKHKDDALAEIGLTKKDLGQDEVVAAKYRELGVEPDIKTTAKGNSKYAFAKTDQFMRDMLEDADERVAALTAARLGIKSSLNETRCARLLEMNARGPLCVYLRYAGAHPTRWSGGDSMNWQNYPRSERDGRPGEIRGSLLAPPGYALVVADESQIECRVLNWLAGQWDVIQRFANKEDPYIGIASQFYGFQVTKAHPKERGTGKQLELSCLGPDTLVLTDHGYIRIVDVTTKHRVWDGEEWVQHSGLAARGNRKVLKVCGVQLTPDHRVLCGNTWVEAQSLQNENILSLALARGRANLPSQAIRSAAKAALLRLWCVVRAAARNIPLTPTIFSLDALRAAMHALKKLPAIGQKNITATPTWFLRTIIENACLTASPRLLTAAQTQNIDAGTITAAEALHVFGTQIAAPSSLTSLRSPAHSILNLNWIELITTKGMSPAISVSLRTTKTAITEELFTSSNELLPTYDLLLAGPRNRFTIATDAGPLIVHNCGYGASGPSIVETAKRGTYGPPVYLSQEDGERAKFLYRNTHKMVTKLWWETAEQALEVLEARTAMTWGPMHIEDGAIWLPNGLPLWYDEFRRDGEGLFCLIGGKWRKMWGTKLVQHVCEALARTVVSQAMLRIPYRPINCTHDEVKYCVPLDEAPATLDTVLRELKRTPDWAPNLPLDAEGFYGARYSK